MQMELYSIYIQIRLQSMPENLEFTDQEISYNTRLPEVIDFDVPGDYTDGVALYFFWEFSAKSTGFNGLNHGTQQFIYEGENITHFGSPDVFGYIGNNTSKSDFAFPLPSTLGSDWETANESSEYKFIAVRLIPDDTATGIVSVTLRDGVIRGPRSFDIDDITMVSGQQSGSTGQQSGARSVENEITFTRTYESDAGTNGANVGRDEFGITNGDNTVLYIGHISQALALSNLDEDNSIVITQGSNEVIYELDSEDSITATHFSVEATLSSGDPSLLIDGSSVSITIRPPTPPPPPTIQQVGPLNIVVLEPYSVEIQLGGEIDSNGVEVEGLWKEFSYNYNPTTKIITVSGTADELLSDGEWLITVTGPGGTSELITVYNFIHQTLVIHEPVVRTFYKGVDVRFFIRIDNIFEQVSVRGLLLGLGWEAGEQESDDPDNPLMGIWIYGNVPDSEFTQDFGRAAIEAVNTAGIVTGGFDYNIEDANPASLSITASDSTISSGSEVTFTFTFGRDIDGFDLEDILLSAGEIGELTKISNTVWELTATAPSEGEGEIEVSVDANVVNQGNDAASLSVDYEIDRAGLSISFTAQTRPVISSQSIVVTFTFDRNVTFTMNNISNTDSNVTLSNFQNVNGRVYRATATAPASGIGRFSLFVVEDTVPELNESASSGSIYYAPSGDAVLNITSIQVGPGSSGTFGTSTFVGSRTHTIQFEFDRFVSGLNLSEISAVYDPVIPTNLPSPLQDLSFSFSGLSNLSSGGNSDGSYIYQATIRVPRILGSGYDSYIDIDGGTTTVSLASDRVVPGNNADSIVIDWG